MSCELEAVLRFLFHETGEWEAGEEVTLELVALFRTMLQSPADAFSPSSFSLLLKFIFKKMSEKSLQPTFLMLLEKACDALDPRVGLLQIIQEATALESQCLAGIVEVISEWLLALLATFEAESSGLPLSELFYFVKKYVLQGESSQSKQTAVDILRKLQELQGADTAVWLQDLPSSVVKLLIEPSDKAKSLKGEVPSSNVSSRIRGPNPSCSSQKPNEV